MGNKFAPEYSKKEKVKRILITSFIFIPSFVATQYYLKSIDIDSFIEQQYGACSGAELLFYSLFIGFPLLISVPLIFYASFRGVRVFRHKQDPIQGEKVWKTRKYHYGLHAYIKYIFLLCLGLCIMCLTFPGIEYAKEYIEMANK